MASQLRVSLLDDKTLLDRLNVGVLRLTVEGEVVDANRACKILLERFGQAHDGNENALLAAVREAIAQLKARDDDADREVELHTRDAGSICLCLSVSRARVNGHDAIDVLVEDVTKIRRSAERNDDLERVNGALESFAYTVSHDLRAPLRNMQGYVRALNEECSSGMSDDCRGYVLAMEEVAVRMDRLVADVLELSRLARVELPSRAVDLRGAVEEALVVLQSVVESRAAVIEVEIAPALVAWGHPPTLARTLTNLLSNALKFVSEGVRPRVRVWAERHDPSQIRVWVEDNGIGIEPANQQRIFEVFQRLHGEEKYPGTGIGLALVRKGVERMGGQVGVQSAPGRGSRFWIDLREPA
jgi:signal transduction histidine kinase